METNETNEIGIGDKEKASLQPARIKILTAEISEIETKKGRMKKVTCVCKHPQRDEAISISSVKFEKGTALKTSGIWYDLDEDGKIRKGSPLACLLTKVGETKISLNGNSIMNLQGKEVDTILDEKGYLCIKSY